jgi:lysine/ornithine N-monooxygenase
MRFGVEVPDFKKTKGGYTVSVQDLNNPSAAPTQIFAKTLIDCTTSRMGSAPPHKPMLGECPNNIYPNSIEKMDIPKVAASDKRIAVIGGGKTGADAVVHLVRNGVDPKQIVWIKKWARAASACAARRTRAAAVHRRRQCSPSQPSPSPPSASPTTAVPSPTCHRHV